MTTDEIKDLIRMVEESGIAELEVQWGENRVRIRRHAKSRNEGMVMPTMVSVPLATALTQNSTTPDVAAPLTNPEPVAKEEDRTVSVKSPIVGTYYDAPSPGTAPFVKVGDTVYPKQVLCIIESMKLMNEIESEISGTIVAKAVEDGRPVEYGELLFTIQPL